MSKLCKKTIICGLVWILAAAMVTTGADDIKTPVIVDTDVALDDLRALTLLLSNGNYRIMAVVTSDGACSPEKGAINILKALGFLGAENIPVGAGRELNDAPPPWRPMAEAMGWADVPEDEVAQPISPAVAILDRAVRDINEKIIYVCFGPLSNLAEWLRGNPSAKNKIGAIYYYGTLSDKSRLSWNTARDTVAAREVLKSGLNIYTCGGLDSLLLTFDTVLYDSLCRLTSRESVFLKKLHANEKVLNLLKRGHFTAWDETVALSLMEPTTAVFKRVEALPSLYYLEYFDRRVARNFYLKTLTGE